MTAATKIMLPTERLDYSPIAGRRPLMLPGGARLAMWVIVNVEEWDPREPMPRTVLTPPAGGAPMPDIPNPRGWLALVVWDAGPEHTAALRREFRTAWHVEPLEAA